jgi:hypothetical protein
VRRFRLPISAVMLAVAIVAIDVAACRSVYRSGRSIVEPPAIRVMFVIYVLGVVPMASLLVFFAAMRVPGLVRRGGDATFLAGFQIFGWAGLFAFIAASAVWPLAMAHYVELALNPIGRVISPWINNAPDWLVDAFELVFVAGAYGVPQLLLALAGGMLVRKSGVRIRVEPRGTAP